MTYIDIINFVHSSPMRKPINNLDSINRLLLKINNPQDNQKIVHIAGTNGKGSTSSFMTTVLAKSGYKVGFLVSPFIHVFNERFQINNENIPNEKLLKHGSIVKKACEEIVAEGYERPVQFEINTAIGFLYFKEENCDLVVLEVGIGGTYDATNVIRNPLVSLITSISKDHTSLLGNTLEEIAENKAGIIKDGSPVIIYEENSDSIKDVFIKRAASENSEIKFIKNSDITNRKINYTIPYTQSYDYKYTSSKNEKAKDFLDIKLQMLGEHQLSNATLALEGLLSLKHQGYDKITKDTIYSGLFNTTWPGRFEILSYNPTFIIDGAHNIDGAKMLVKNIETYFKGKKLYFAAGFLKDKDYQPILDIVLPYSKIFVTYKPQDIRGLDNKVFTKYIVEQGGIVEEKSTPKEAIQYLIDVAEKDSVICAFGSLYSVADFRDFFK